MHQTFLPESVLSILQEDLGNLLHNYYDNYISTNASSSANGTGKLSRVRNEDNKGYLHLPTFTNIYGYPYPAYPQFDISLHARGQLPLFRLGHSRFSGHSCGWTQNCADNTSKFVYCGDHFGNNVCGLEGNDTRFVSPLFIIS